MKHLHKTILSNFKKPTTSMLFSSAVSGLIFLGSSNTVSFAQEYAARSATCLLNVKSQSSFVKGEKAIHGDCTFMPFDEKGSFRIEGSDGRHFASVTITEENIGTGRWNQLPSQLQFTYPLGTLRREKGCWVNATTELCAYSKITAPDNVRNKEDSLEQIRDFFELGRGLPQPTKESILINRRIAIQTRLSELSYYTGEADSMWGAQMYEAVSDFMNEVNKDGTYIELRDPKAIEKFIYTLLGPIINEEYDGPVVAAKQPDATDLEKEELTPAEVETLETSEAIRLVGIDLEMGIPLRRKILTQRNYKCGKSKLRNNEITCENGDKSIFITDDKLTFTCANFNACKLTLEEFAQAIIDNGIIEELDYDITTITQFGSASNIESYCGRGTGGDWLCVVQGENLFGGRLIQVTIDVGALGSDGVSFD